MSNKVTARAVVSMKQEWGTGDGRSASIQMTADYQDNRNAAWAAATPSFVTSMTVKGEIADLINLGDKVAVTLDINPEAVALGEGVPLSEDDVTDIEPDKNDEPLPL